MAKIGRVCKEYMVKELTKKLKNSQNIFVTDCTGLNVSDLSRLKARLKPNKDYYIVIKNSLGKLALKNVDREALNPLIEGTIGLVIGGQDPILTSKALLGFAKTSKKLKVKGAIIDGEVVSEADIRTLSALPTKGVLLAMVCGGMKAPIYGFVNVLSGTINKFVYAVNAVKEKKEKR